jgi:YaiO family outer membrane protein
MRTYVILFLAGAFTCSSLLPAHAQTVTDLLAQSRILAGEKRYEEAHQTLERALAIEPKNDDIRLLRGQLYYYQGDYEAAEAEFTGILSRHPEYVDAKAALERVQTARDSGGEFRWQADAGYEWSGFERRNQPDWNNQFLQLTRFFDGRATAVHGRIERYDQFTNIDSYYQLGVDHRFTPRLMGYVATGFSSGADFRPHWRVKGGGGFRLSEMEIQNMPLWLTLDMQHDEYQSTEVSNINPGLRMEFSDSWALGSKIIAVHEHGAKTVYGWMARFDGQIMPGWRFYTGYADAPETVAAVTVDTQTMFGGFAYDIDDARTLYLGYTRDDRENSYIRHGVNACVSFRF